MCNTPSYSDYIDKMWLNPSSAATYAYPFCHRESIPNPHLSSHTHDLTPFLNYIYFPLGLRKSCTLYLITHSGSVTIGDTCREHSAWNRGWISAQFYSMGCATTPHWLLTLRRTTNFWIRANRRGWPTLPDFLHIKIHHHHRHRRSISAQQEQAGRSRQTRERRRRVFQAHTFCPVLTTKAVSWRRNYHCGRLLMLLLLLSQSCLPSRRELAGGRDEPAGEVESVRKAIWCLFASKLPRQDDGPADGPASQSVSQSARTTNQSTNGQR